MNSMLDDDEDDLERKDRELTLSTGMILGIFFALVLLCGLFFGFGYRMGSHTVSQPLAASSAENAPPADATFSGFKPAPGSPAGGRTESSENSAATTPTAAAAAGDASESSAGSLVGAPAVSVNPATPARTGTPVVTTPAPPVAAGSFVVQVAAVSHEEDAQLLVNALRAKGYPVSAHTEPQDKFFHIQVGPFTNLKDANAAKQRLLADGYQPIVK
jgi:cell division septation protein DedD